VRAGFNRGSAASPDEAAKRSVINLCVLVTGVDREGDEAVDLWALDEVHFQQLS
jgi:hypothetical protein